MTIQQIAQALGRTVADQRQVTAISTDSREIPKGCLFVALKGENFDGHDYVATALQQGAIGAVVAHAGNYGDGVILQTQDTTQALIDIAGMYRSMFTPKVVGVTGSVGKTTTKEFIYAVLCAQYKTLKTQGNLNNEVGLPKTLFALDETIEAAVIEMGMSGKGEIAALTKATKPDVGVITNIGVSHIEHLGSREQILQAKLELTQGMADGAPLLLCADNDLLATVRDPRLTLVTYGIKAPDCTIRALHVQHEQTHTRFDIAYEGQKYSVVIPTMGEHNVLNALAAFGVGVLLGVSPQQAVEALGCYEATGMRQKVVRHHSFTVVEDCYNASPDSMFAAINAFSSMSCKGRRILVLADMLELGSISQEQHRLVGAAVAKNPIHLLLCIGQWAQEYRVGAMDSGMREAFYFRDKEELFRFLQDNICRDDTLWFKASRGMKLEEVIQRLYEEC